MNDRPTREELLEAVQRFMQEELLPRLDGHLRYQTLVAANVVRIVSRELADEPGQIESEWRRLAALYAHERIWSGDLQAARADIAEWTRQLVETIRSGEADAEPLRSAVVSHLRENVAEKLRVAKGDAELALPASED